MAYRVAPINLFANGDDVVYHLNFYLVVDIVGDLVEHFNANLLLSDTLNNYFNTHYTRRYSIYGNPLHLPA